MAKTLKAKKDNENLKEQAHESSSLESRVQLLSMIITRIFKENLQEAYKGTIQNIDQQMDSGYPQEEHASKYYESIQILNLNPDEIEQFVNINAKTVKKSSPEIGNISFQHHKNEIMLQIFSFLTFQTNISTK